MPKGSTSVRQKGGGGSDVVLYSCTSSMPIKCIRQTVENVFPRARSSAPTGGIAGWGGGAILIMNIRMALSHRHWPLTSHPYNE